MIVNGDATDGAGDAATANRTPSAAAVLDLERIAALGWPGIEQEWVDGWLLRAGGGWTGRANSALPLNEVGDGLDVVLPRVARWYAVRGLRQLVQVPLPARDALRRRLVGRGWVDQWGAVMLTACVDDVLARVRTSSHVSGLQVSPVPDRRWLDAYHYRGGQLPAVARRVLCAGTSPRFLSIVEGGETIAIARSAVTQRWVGITAVEVAARHRRRGLARQLLVGALHDARTGGAEQAYLQTTLDNTAALRLYTAAGFARHHVYRYHGPPPGSRRHPERR